MTESKPVELLRDRRGIYGIGVSDAYDIEALAWACGADPKDTWQIRRVSNLILRPDMLQFGKQWHDRSFAVLQKNHGRISAPRCVPLARRKPAPSHAPRSIDSRRVTSA
jgi:hypothetical protein